MKLIQYSLVSIAVIFACGTTYLAVIDKDYRAGYSNIAGNAVTGLFALATGGAVGYQAGKEKEKQNSNEVEKDPEG